MCWDRMGECKVYSFLMDMYVQIYVGMEIFEEYMSCFLF